LLVLLSAKFHNQRQFAHAIDVDPTRLSRAMNGDPVMFDTLHCLYVARATGADPLVVLRAAQKAETADVLGDLFEKALTDTERKVLRAFRKFTPEAARALMVVFEDALGITSTNLRPPTRRRQRGPVVIGKQRGVAG
jgi:hypothetical protein